MFERFTDQARRVVVLAQEEARLLGHGYIGTEHILLGLLAEGEGLAFQALASLGISLDAAREQVAEIIGEGAVQPSGHIPFTPRSKKVLELSLREALQLGDSYIGTEHILLGLAREGEGVGAQVMDRLGAGKDRVLAQVLLIRQTELGPELRRVAIGRQMPIERPMGARSVVNRLDEISERLSAIENLLAEMRGPAARPRKPAPGGARKPPAAQRKPPGGAQRKPPAGGAEPPGHGKPTDQAEPPGGEPPAAEA
jgi:ATP-dependent Clp protease ATP-binding subunit ClpA